MLLSASLALAAEGFDVMRGAPAVAGGWPTVPDVRLEEPAGVGARWTASWVDDPLVWQAADGSEIPRVHAAWGGELTASAHHGAFVLGLSLPAWVVTGPQLAPAFGLGDARLTALARVRRVGTGALGLSAELRLPTGDPERWTGAGGPAGGAGLAGAGRLGRFELAATVGVDTAPAWEVPGFRWGPRFMWSAAAAHPLPLGLRLLAEVDGAVPLGPGGGPPPIEARLGLGLRPSDRLDLAIAGGTGLSSGVGAPDARAVVQLRYLPGPMPR